MNSIKDYLVQDIHVEGEYREYLHRPLFEVNMRLYDSSVRYQSLVNSTIEYMVYMFGKELEDYGPLCGISGANLGIPFNIIAIKFPSDIQVMVNPKVLKRQGEIKVVVSNCGSLILDDPVKVPRRTEIKVKYRPVIHKDKEITILPEQNKWFKRPEAFTIQHEVDHNNGITILDRYDS